MARGADGFVAVRVRVESHRPKFAKFRPSDANQKLGRRSKEPRRSQHTGFPAVEIWCHSVQSETTHVAIGWVVRNALWVVVCRRVSEAEV